MFSLRHSIKNSIRKSRKAFTLIELLVSLAIFSFVIALASYSFGFFSNVIRKIVEPYPTEAIGFSTLDNALKSVFYYVSEVNRLGKTDFFLYFYGTKDSMQFISTKSFFKDNLAICRLYVKDGQLILEQYPLFYKKYDYKSPNLKEIEKLVNPKRIVLFRGLSNIKIRYLIGKQSFESVRRKIPTDILMNVETNDGNFDFLFHIESNYNKKLLWARYVYWSQKK